MASSGISTALTNAQGLQTRLFQKFGELKRPVISKAKSAQEVEDEERGLKSMQEKLNTLEKKLRIFRDLDSSKADERANVMTTLDGARRELLAAAREFEAYSFGSKDIIQSIMDFCQLKQSQVQSDASPRTFKPTFKSSVPQSRRDDQPPPHPDQNDRSARRYSSGNTPAGAAAIPSVMVGPMPSSLSTSASKRYPHTDTQPQQPPQQASQQPSLSSRLPRFPAAEAGAHASSMHKQSAAPPSLNITVPQGPPHANSYNSSTSSGSRQANNNSNGSESMAPTSTALSSACKLSRASSLPKAPGVPGAAPAQAQGPAMPPTAAAAAAAPELPASAQAAAPLAASADKAALPAQSLPASPAVGASGFGPRSTEHSPQMTQDSSLCNMDSMCGAGTYPEVPNEAGTTGPSSRIKALMQLHGQDTASSIPAPAAAPVRPRMLDAYITAAKGGVHTKEQPIDDQMQDQRGSELTLGHIIAKPSAVAATGTLRPSQLLRNANSNAFSGSNVLSESSSSSLTLSANAEQSPAHPAPKQDATVMNNSKEASSGPPALKAHAVNGRPAPIAVASAAHAGLEGDSVTPPAHSLRPNNAYTTDTSTGAAAAAAAALSPALSSTYSSSPKLNGGKGGDKQEGLTGALSPDDCKYLARCEQDPPAVSAQPPHKGAQGPVNSGVASEWMAKRGPQPTSGSVSNESSPSTSNVAKLQQQFLQGVMQQQQLQPQEPATPCNDSVLGMLRAGSSVGHRAQLQQQQQQHKDGQDEEAWQSEAQRTTARAPAPQAAAAHERSTVQVRTLKGAFMNTPSSCTPEAAAAGDGSAASKSAKESGAMQKQGAACGARSGGTGVASNGFGASVATAGVTAAGAALTTAAPILPHQQSRGVAEQQLLLQPHAHRMAGAGGAKTGGPPASVLAAGPQLAAAGVVSVPPNFSRCTTRTCDAWEAEGGEELYDAVLEPPHQVHGGSCRRHTVPDPALDLHLQQQLRVRAPRSLPAQSRGPSTPSCYMVQGGGPSYKKKRGLWGGILRVVGITTTVASVAIVTGAAVFAAAALNTGLDELDLMHPETGRMISSGGRGPFKRKLGLELQVQRAKCPQSSNLCHPDALAAGRG